MTGRYALTDEQHAALVAERAAQGLPPTIEDESILRRIATIVDHALDTPHSSHRPRRDRTASATKHGGTSSRRAS